MQALKEADRRKDEFLAVLAHELRNPLAPVRNPIEIIRSAPGSSPQLQWTHDVIDRQVRRLVELHGGRVEAQSDGIGRGSEFVVDLPLADVGEAKQAHTHDHRAAQPQRARRILVVDDNRDAADSLCGPQAREGIGLRLPPHQAGRAARHRAPRGRRASGAVTRSAKR